MVAALAHLSDSGVRGLALDLVGFEISGQVVVFPTVVTYDAKAMMVVLTSIGATSRGPLNLAMVKVWRLITLLHRVADG